MSANYNSWIEIATRDLCDEAKRRVRAEVEQHFNSAKDAAIRGGLDETCALADALKTLGNPKRARKRFNRLYLTAQQLGWIRAIAMGYAKAFRLLFLGMYVSGLMSFTYLLSSSETRYDTWEAFGQFLSSLMWGSMAFSAFWGRRYLRFSIASVGLSLPLSMTGILMKWTANKLAEGSLVYDEPLGIVIFILAGLFSIASSHEFASVLMKLRRRYNRDIAGI